jgi:nitrite reductase/ring-hydroxylating ferredoxin subunit/uncharacterized membrane protein
MLIPFPFAFLTGAVAFDLAGWALESTAFWTTGAYLAAAGVATGLLAAVPGLVDYLTVVPPRSSGTRRATKHMLSNGTALLLFGVAWLVRGDAPSQAGVVLAIEAVGLALLGIGSWMGGTLLYRNQIAVDHRYAEAGKWTEATVTHGENPRFAPAGRVSDLRPGQMKLLHVDDRRIVLGRTENGIVAFADRCTHRGASLADGVLICGVVQCPWHGSQFDTTSGEVKAGPAERPIAVYRVLEVNGELDIDLRHSAGPRSE